MHVWILCSCTRWWSWRRRRRRRNGGSASSWQRKRKLKRSGTVSRYWRYSYFGKAMARGRERCPGIGGTVTLEKPWREARNGVQILEVQLLWKSNGVRPGTTSRCWKYSYFGEAMARGQESCQCVEDTLLNSSMMTSAVKCVCAWWV